MTSLPLMSRPRQTSRPSAVLRPWLLALVIGFAFLAIRHGALTQPPVWDGAMGMTPAALTLESSDFDIGGLLRQPDYRAGGPNIHSLSLATWSVAASIRLFGSYQAALPFLHIISFLLAGLLAAGVYRAVLFQTSRRPLALMGAITAVVFPPMVVQASDVYLDLPLAVAVTWAFVYIFEDRTGKGVALLAIAAAIKPSALIAIPPIAIYMLMSAGKPRRALAWLAVPTLVAFIPLLADAALRQEDTDVLQGTLDTFGFGVGYLSKMPVLLGVLLLALAVPLVGRLNHSVEGLDSRRWAVIISSLAMPMTFFYFFLLNPLVSKGVPALPRYTTMFLPVVIIGLCVSLDAVVTRRTAILTCAVVGVVFVLNMYGALEPGSSNQYWMAERSLAYEDFLSVQQEAFTAFADEAAELPSYYDHFAHFRIEYPASGWLDSPLPGGTNVHLDETLASPDLTNLPPDFVLLVESPCCGGPRLEGLLLAAEASPAHEVTVETFTKGEFMSRVAQIRQIELGG